MVRFEKLAAFIAAHRSKIGKILAGHGIYSAISWVFDNPLYIGVIASLGVIWGGLTMTLLSLLVNLGLVVYYGRKKVDWLGYDLADNLKWAKHGDAVAFLILSVWEDPFITTAYLRHGQHDGLKKRDWGVFFGSVLVSNGYWTLRNAALLEGVKFLWKAFVG